MYMTRRGRRRDVGGMRKGRSLLEVMKTERRENKGKEDRWIEYERKKEEENKKDALRRRGKERSLGELLKRAGRGKGE